MVPWWVLLLPNLPPFPGPIQPPACPITSRFPQPSPVQPSPLPLFQLLSKLSRDSRHHCCANPAVHCLWLWYWDCWCCHTCNSNKHSFQQHKTAAKLFGPLNNWAVKDWAVKQLRLPKSLPLILSPSPHCFHPYLL